MRGLLIVSGALWFFLVMIEPAHAYLDPTNGSMMLQVILGGLAGIAMFIKLLWSKIWDKLRRIRPSQGRAPFRQ